MEEIPFILFVLALLLAAFFVTQTIRRDLKAKEALKNYLRRESMHVRPSVSARGPRTTHAPPRMRRQQSSESPPNRL
jgi:hypothetical protein